MIFRKLVIKVILVVLVSIEGCLSTKNNINKPHIIFILADDLGWNDVPWHNSRVVAPNLSSLALNGIILNQSYVQPVCTPSRSALLTGKYPFTIGRQHGILHPLEPTGLLLNATLLQQSLKNVGYSTHAVGKWHLGFCSWKFTPTFRGFDSFFGYYNGAQDYYQHTIAPRNHRKFDDDSAGKKVLYDSFEEESMKMNYPKMKYPIGYDFRRDTKPFLEAKGKYSTYVYAEYLEELILSRNASDALFLYLALQSPHSPMQVPDNYTIPFRDIHDGDRKTYLGMVSAMDEVIGRLVSALKRSGHYENTLIVFSTDNGGPTHYGANNWPLRGNKGTLWEGGTRGVAFIHSPMLNNNGTVNNQLFHITDWLPTLVGVAGGVVPQGIDGIDQWAALQGLAPSPRQELVYNIDSVPKLSAAIRFGDYKLVINNPGNGNWTPPPENITTNQTLESMWKETLEDPHKVTTDTVKEQIKETVQEQIKGIVQEDIKETLTEHIQETTKEQITEDVKKPIKEHVILSVTKRGLLPVSPKFEILRRTSNDAWDHLANEKMHRLNRKRKIGVKSKKVIINNRIKKRELGSHDMETLTEDIQTEKKVESKNEKLAKLEQKFEMMLFNIKDDPEERHDLSSENYELVQMLFNRLVKQMERVVPADSKKPDWAGNPANYGGIWTPGWCEF